ncbi:MAG: T9SS type A sorting domain-containing protein [Ignavibacteria bacterium]|nr:T9SS type A sorting domain-containing protein [Ignavibacteria bacterium]
MNRIPDEHLLAGISLAHQIGPVDLSGNPDPVSGKLVLLSIGMSNSWQEFSVFKDMVESYPDRSSSLVVVNGAQPGNDINTILDPESGYWPNVIDSLGAAGVTSSQVQAIWFKQAEAFSGISGNDTSFHGYTGELREKFRDAMNMIRTQFPNARVCYLASRIYGGYASIQLSPEPFAYFTGWAVKQLIEDQIHGSPTLRYQGDDPVAPWLAWGTYLWADGMIPRGDGLIWECSDFQRDGTHPSESGEIKVASGLLDFFSTDETAVPWFLEGTATSVAANEEMPRNFEVAVYPNPFNPEARIRFELASAGHVRLVVLDVTGQTVREIMNADLPGGTHEGVFHAGELGSGVYFYQLHAGGRVVNGKMVLVR